ncbi:MAG: hypothetical protein ACI837_001015 [Crocinitomicaceae bacterium]|jgi:hypothetical protein
MVKFSEFRFMRFYVLLLSAVIINQSCKKDTVPVPITPNEVALNVAPCEIQEKFYTTDSVFYGPDNYFPQAKFRIKFLDTNVTTPNYIGLLFAFNKIPTTGMYRMLPYIDTNFQLPNQIAFVKDSGSFLLRSDASDFDEVYVENNNNEIIISYCNISNNIPWFNSITQSYYANLPKTLKIRKEY